MFTQTEQGRKEVEVQWKLTLATIAVFILCAQDLSNFLPLHFSPFIVGPVEGILVGTSATFEPVDALREADGSRGARDCQRI